MQASTGRPDHSLHEALQRGVSRDNLVEVRGSLLLQQLVVDRGGQLKVASATAAEGAEATFVVEDETEHWQVAQQEGRTRGG